MIPSPPLSELEIVRLFIAGHGKWEISRRLKLADGMIWNSIYAAILKLPLSPEQHAALGLDEKPGREGPAHVEDWRRVFRDALGDE